MIIKDVFDVISYHQITDEELYHSKGEIPVYTGSNELKGYWNKSFLSDESVLPCISFPLKGNAGVAFVQSSSFDANNTGLLVPKSKYRNKLNLEWFTFRLPSLFFDSMTNKEGVSFINKSLLEKQEVVVPSLEVQVGELLYFKKLDELDKKVKSLKEKIIQALERDINLDHDLESKLIPLSDIMSYKSRNDALSEEGIYRLSPKSTTQTTIDVVSGSTGNIFYGTINSDAKKIHSLKNKPCLHIVTRGKAGKLTYLPKGHYASNTNAFLLYIKSDFFEKAGIKNEVDEAEYLQYLRLYLEPKFIELSSQSDLSVFPLTKVFKSFEVPFFKIDKNKKMLLQKVIELQSMFEKIDEFTNKVNNLKDKVVISNVHI